MKFAPGYAGSHCASAPSVTVQSGVGAALVRGLLRERHDGRQKGGKRHQASAELG